MRIVVRITPITPNFIEGYRRALDTVARERCYISMVEAPPLVETCDFVRRILKDGVQLIVLSGDEVVGWIDVHRHILPSQAHRGTLGMGLIPSHRGHGVGRMLIDAGLERAWAVGFKRVELNVHTDNKVAIKLYEKVGFAHEGIIRNASLIDGQYRDAFVMAILR